MKRFFIAMTALTLLMGIWPLSAAEVPEAELHLSIKAGGLSEALSASQFKGEKLVLDGTADVRDFRTLASSLPASVKSLDLLDLSIAAYTYTIPQNDGRRFFPADELPAWALFSLPISEISLPSSLKSIGEGALAATMLESVVIPSGVKEMGSYSLFGCKALSSADLSRSCLTEIPEHCFEGCKILAVISLPTTLREVESFSFSGSGLKSLSLPTVTRFSDFALARMSCLEEVSFSPNATFGKGVLMSDTALLSVSGSPEAIPALFATGCTSFDGSSITADASDIGSWALTSSSSRRVTFNTLRSIGEGALADMKNLDEIDVRELGSSLPEVDEDTFKGIHPSDIKLLVSSDSEQQWREHPVWGSFQVVPDYMVEAAMPLSPSEHDITVSYINDTLYLESDSELEYVSLYTVDGETIYTGNLSGSSAELIISRDTYALNQGDFIVVLVKSIDGLKAMKLKI